MTAGPTHHTQRPGPWTLVLFACVLVLAQALLVGHQVGHLAHGDETAACEICLIGGGLKHQLIMARLMEPDQEPNITRGVLDGRSLRRRKPPILHRLGIGWLPGPA